MLQLQRRAGCRVELPLKGPDREACEPRELSEVRVGGTRKGQSTARVQNGAAGASHVGKSDGREGGWGRGGTGEPGSRWERPGLRSLREAAHIPHCTCLLPPASRGHSVYAPASHRSLQTGGPSFWLKRLPRVLLSSLGLSCPVCKGESHCPSPGVRTW